MRKLNPHLFFPRVWNPLLVALLLLAAFSCSYSFGQGEAAIPRRELWEQAKAAHQGEGPVLWVIFPKDGSLQGASVVRFGGATDPGSNLTINGKKVKTFQDGVFAGTIPLSVGRNLITFRSSSNGKFTARTVEVRRSRQLQALPAQPLAVGAQIPSQPLGNLELLPGEMIPVRCQATPGAIAYFQIGNQKTRYPMQELPLQPGGAAISGIYVGSYLVERGDSFDKAKIQITLEIVHEGKRQVISMVPSGTLTTGNRRIRRIVEALENDTGIYTDPSRDVRHLSAAKGTELQITGRQGDMLRTRLDKTMDAWVPLDKVQVVPDKKRIPIARLEEISVKSESAIGSTSREDAQFTFLVKQKGHFQSPPPVRVSLAERESAISLTVYGMRADEFQITSDGSKRLSKPWQSKLESSMGANEFATDMQCHPLDDRSTIFRFGLSRKVWGYQPVFAPDQFGLIIKAPPGPVGGPLGPLAGIRVALDPGHGGNDSGAMGNSGLSEADANWVIAQRVAGLLRAAKAEVYVTREQNEYVSLNDRVMRLRECGADVLLSIHCDSVPENGDPLQSRGTSLFYFYPQGDRLAQQVRVSLAETLGSEVPFLKTAQRDLRVIRGCPQMPGALIECLFISNPNDEMLLLNPAFLDRIGAGIYKGLVSFLQNAGAEEEDQEAKNVANRTDAAGRIQAWAEKRREQRRETAGPAGMAPQLEKGGRGGPDGRAGQAKVFGQAGLIVRVAGG